MRKLASIQRVISTSPIEGADRIELVHVLGWQCVAGKGDFKPGDLCVYFEIDSFLPIEPEYEMLRKNSYKNNEFMGEGFKLKTMKFKGQLSQGLVMLPTQLPKLANIALTEGMDVTTILGVREWEMPEVAGSDGTIKSGRPGFIPKTDETRIQSMTSLLEEFKGLPYYITTKMDGSSHSIGSDCDQVSYTTHNCTIVDDGNSPFIKYIKDHLFDDKLMEYKIRHNLQSIVVQGEWCGEGIQKNRLKLQKPEWFVFTVILDGKRGTFDQLKDVVNYLGCSMVPVEEEGDDLTIKYPTMDDLLIRSSEGQGYNNTTREGIVIRPKETVYSKSLQGPLSMKVINNKYLLKYESN